MNLKIIKDYLNAIEGKTDIECFNQWVNELKENNYLHNHTRMWFASIWIFTLELPWQLGAEFFMTTSLRWRCCIKYSWLEMGSRYSNTRKTLPCK